MAEYIVEANDLEDLENGFYSICNNGEPIVLCKDCKWFNGTEGENPFSNVSFCDLDNNLVRFVDDNDFCSRGERRG